MTYRSLLMMVFFAFSNSGCALLMVAQAQQAQSDARDQLDQSQVKSVAEARARAQAKPNSPREVTGWSVALQVAYNVGTVARGKLDGAAELTAVCQALDAAAQAHPDERAYLLAEKGRLLITAGHKDEAVRCAARFHGCQAHRICSRPAARSPRR